MHGDRRDTALTDAALDREIERALAVDPSPDFTARVRMRIAREPAHSLSRRVNWAMCFAGGAVAAAVIAFAFIVRGPRPAGSDTFLPARAFVAPSAAFLPSVTSNFRRGSHLARAVSRSSTTKRPQSEIASGIVIDMREARTLQRLIAGVRDGHINLNPVLRASTPNVLDLPPIADIVIAPLTIEPLAPIEGAEGVRQ